MKIANMGTVVKITLFHQFSSLTTSTNLWMDVAGYHLAKRTTVNDCVELCFICLQYLPNIL